MYEKSPEIPDSTEWDRGTCPTSRSVSVQYSLQRGKKTLKKPEHFNLNRTERTMRDYQDLSHPVKSSCRWFHAVFQGAFRRAVKPQLTGSEFHTRRIGSTRAEGNVKTGLTVKSEVCYYMFELWAKEITVWADCHMKHDAWSPPTKTWCMMTKGSLSWNEPCEQLKQLLA